MQPLAQQVAFDQITAEYSDVVQVAGLRTSIIDICRNDAATANEFRRLLLCQLQGCLPKSVPLSVRAEPSPQATGQWLAQTEAKVKAAVIEAAHQSETLRPVVLRDRTGRECTEYYGKKRSWMHQYASPPQLMTTMNHQPVRIPTVL